MPLDQLLFVAGTRIELVLHAWEARVLASRRTRRLIERKLGDSNPRYGYPYVSLANWWFQPLTQTSLNPHSLSNAVQI